MRILKYNCMWILIMALTACTIPTQALRPPKPPPAQTAAVPTSTLSNTMNRPNNPQIGLNFIRFYWQNGLDAAIVQPEAIFADFKDLGIHTFRQFVKADLLWDVVEPQDNQWNFAASDTVLANPDFEPIVTLFAMQYASATPPWAKTPAEFQKTMGPEATDYLTTVVQRYAPYVRYWELGNEMDHWRAAASNENAAPIDKMPSAHPLDGFSPQEQGVFLAQAAAIIRANDPDAVILMPGMSGLDDYTIQTWLSGVVSGGGTNWFDIINYHFYSSWERYTLLRPHLNSAIQTLKLDNKPIWQTETGSTSSPTLVIRTNYPNSTTSQSADVFRRIVQSYGYGDQLVMWHTYIGSGGESDWRAYGIRSETGEIQPAYWSFKLLVSELIPFERVETIASDAKGINVYAIYTRTAQVKYVAWGSGSYTVPVGPSQITQVTPDAQGSFNWQPVQTGQTLLLSSIPILLR